MLLIVMYETRTWRLRPGDAFTFGRSPTSSAVLPAQDSGLSRHAGSFSFNHDCWWVHNTSRSSLLYLTGDLGFRVDLPPGMRAPLQQWHIKVRLHGFLDDYTLRLRLPDLDDEDEPGTAAGPGAGVSADGDAARGAGDASGPEETAGAGDAAGGGDAAGPGAAAAAAGAATGPNLIRAPDGASGSAGAGEPGGASGPDGTREPGGASGPDGTSGSEQAGGGERAGEPGPGMPAPARPARRRIRAESVVTSTHNKLPLTDGDRLVLAARFEDYLTWRHAGAPAPRSAAETAERIGWEPHTVVKRCENIRNKYTRMGIPGLRGPRALEELIQVLMSTGTLTADDLRRLPSRPGPG
ncbi:MAG TPA: FHA domain-containing protein [Streptosporangiaceae bacterium]